MSVCVRKLLTGLTVFHSVYIKQVCETCLTPVLTQLHICESFIKTRAGFPLFTLSSTDEEIRLKVPVYLLILTSAQMLCNCLPLSRQLVNRDNDAHLEHICASVFSVCKFAVLVGTWIYVCWIACLYSKCSPFMLAV